MANERYFSLQSTLDLQTALVTNISTYKPLWKKNIDLTCTLRFELQTEKNTRDEPKRGGKVREAFWLAKPGSINTTCFKTCFKIGFVEKSAFKTVPCLPPPFLNFSWPKKKTKNISPSSGRKRNSSFPLVSMDGNEQIRIKWFSMHSYGKCRFDLRTFRLTNCLPIWIKFVSRNPTVLFSSVGELRDFPWSSHVPLHPNTVFASVSYLACLFKNKQLWISYHLGNGDTEWYTNCGTVISLNILGMENSGLPENGRQELAWEIQQAHGQESLPKCQVAC